MMIILKYIKYIRKKSVKNQSINNKIIHFITFMIALSFPFHNAFQTNFFIHLHLHSITSIQSQHKYKSKHNK